MKRLLKGGLVISGKNRTYADVLMDGEKITKVEADIQCEDAHVADVTDKLLFPGFIDAHTHFKLEVAGTVTADDFYTGTRAALVGGTTCVVDFATQYKKETLHEALANWHEKADHKSSCDYGFHLAISDWNQQISEELESIVKEGVTSFKLYMTYDDMIVDDEEMYQILTRLKELGGIAGVHCENTGIIKARIAELKAGGKLAPKYHPISRPEEAEAEAISRMLKIASLVDTPVIIVHLSSEQGYREVLAARERGQEVFLETCPQYLLLDENSYRRDEKVSRRYICSPPLRNKVSQDILWKAVEQDEIALLSTDHCSFTDAQKAAGSADFTKVPNGMPGVETRPVLLYTYGVKTGRITLEQMCRLLSENPAKLYGLYPQKGCIAPGSDADIVVWDGDVLWTMTDTNQAANTDYNPYDGFEVWGKPQTVYLRGEEVLADGQVVKENRGRYQRRGLRQQL